ncbi:hypothetical protein [uncultured Mesonia sp.]|uniref:hypothetical protein n=1 Tax=uncultured Mesonia sp. TaxID=399731 RepID=UPI00374F5265
MIEKIRKVIAYKNYFQDFLTKQPIKVQDKIFKVTEAIETFEQIAQNLKSSLSLMRLQIIFKDRMTNMTNLP